LPTVGPLGSLTGGEVEARAWRVFIDRAS
jgi:hypothetical protein